MNYYNYHIGDYRTATAHLTLEEDATYKRLLDYQYDKEAPIQNDPILIARRIRSTDKLVLAMLEEFFVLTEEGWIHQRVMERINEHKEFISKQQDNGRKGGRKPNPNPSLTQRQPSQYPIPNNQLPIPNIETTQQDYFHALPEVLQTEDFKKAWISYLQYRKERRLSSLLPKSLEVKWRQMASWGHEASLRQIDEAIANGWQGIFEPKAEQINKDKPKDKPEQHSKYKDIL